MRRIKSLSVFLTALLLTVSACGESFALAVDSLNPSDFKSESFSKTVDFFNYIRAVAAQYNQTPPSDEVHAYVYINYVNVSGIQMFYAGLSNITSNQKVLTIPHQTVMMHYKSKDGQKDVVTASSFMMLLAFKESSNTIFESSPDMNDTLYASFSLGYDLGEHYDGSGAPPLDSKTEIIPLTSSPDGLQWHWGMKYMNLTAIWWNISIDPRNPLYNLHPIAVSRYDELTFTYNFTINPSAGNATLSTNYVVGRMTDLWLILWPGHPLVSTVHFNATGLYTLRGVKLSNENIYSFLRDQGIKMSIVQFQSTVVLGHSTHFNSSSANVTDNEVSVDNSRISTLTEDGERIFDANFAGKGQYDLYNYTQDSTEKTFETYNTTTRTTKIRGFAMNPIFSVHTLFMRFLPLAVAHVDLELYQQAKDRLLNMSRADYFYIAAYPVYGGYRIQHDPTFTAYAALTTSSTPLDYAPFAVSAVLVAGAISVIVLIRRKGYTS